MAQVAYIPKFITGLLAELQREYPDASLDVRRERDPDGDDYIVAVVSDRLNRLGWDRRHKALFDVARRVLSAEQRVHVSLVPLRPEELDAD